MASAALFGWYIRSAGPVGSNSKGPVASYGDWIYAPCGKARTEETISLIMGEACQICRRYLSVSMLVEKEAGNPIFVQPFFLIRSLQLFLPLLSVVNCSPSSSLFTTIKLTQLEFTPILFRVTDSWVLERKGPVGWWAFFLFFSGWWVFYVRKHGGFSLTQ